LKNCKKTINCFFSSIELFFWTCCTYRISISCF